MIKGLENAEKNLVIEKFNAITKREQMHYQQLKTKAQELADFKEELRKQEIESEEEKAAQIVKDAGDLALQYS